MQLKQKPPTSRVDTKELELPETHFIRDIEDRVFQGIVFQCLSKIKGICLVEGSFIDNLFDRGALEGVKGIYAEQDNKNASVGVKIEVNIEYGFKIPEKAEEIQQVVAEEITKLTGLHVANVHVIFKNVISPQQIKCIKEKQPKEEEIENELQVSSTKIIEDEYPEEL